MRHRPSNAAQTCTAPFPAQLASSSGRTGRDQIYTLIRHCIDPTEKGYCTSPHEREERRREGERERGREGERESNRESNREFVCVRVCVGGCGWACLCLCVCVSVLVNCCTQRGRNQGSEVTRNGMKPSISLCNRCKQRLQPAGRTNKAPASTKKGRAVVRICEAGPPSSTRSSSECTLRVTSAL